MVARLMRPRLLLALVVACGGDDGTPDPVAPTANLAREIIDTQLAYDISTMSATATVPEAATNS